MTDLLERSTTDPIVCLHGEQDVAAWYVDQLVGLDALVWETPADVVLDRTDVASLDRWVDAAVAGITRLSGGRRVHVLATGPAAYGAIVLGARHPEVVTSLLLGDPETDPTEQGYAELLAAVTAPTLVVASAPEPGDPAQTVAAAQSIAGGIANGVFVVIDGALVPAHRERGSSFNEWVTSFTIIAEGLDALGTQRQEDLRA